MISAGNDSGNSSDDNNNDRPSIIVVDDEPDINYLLQEVLEARGYKVDTFQDPSVALDNFSAGKYDLAIVDFKMSPINGFDLYQRFIEIDRDTKVLFLSADSQHYANHKRGLPANESRRYINKPIGIDTLLKQVEDIIKR